MIALRDILRRRGGSADRDDLAALLEALDEPAAICELDGAVVLANRMWAKALGSARRPLPGGAAAFAAFRTARATGRGEGVLPVGEGGRAAVIAAFGVERFLVRLPPPPAGAAAGAEPATLLPQSLAAPAPFGAALVEGADPFAGAILEANAALWAIAGRPAFPGATLADLIAETSRAEVVARLAEGGPGPFEVSLPGAPDRTAQLYLAREGGRIAAYLLDVTAEKDLQLQLAQRHKMEAIGQLAGGVAHDFNNLLSAIGMRVDELLLRHPLGDPAYESLGEVREGVNRAAALVLQLLTFSRKATVRREVVDLGAALIDFEVLLRRLLRENMRLETDHGPGAPLVRIDKAQLEMAIMNLVVNARDALREGGGGAIRLRTARLTAAEAEALGCPARPPGDVALIEVADDGPGIPTAVLGSIFEPFFTTKAAGEGTGLGLATVYGIVKQSDGWIVAASPPGQGATFRIFLPAHVPRLSLEPPAAAARRPPRDLSGAGCILFVEDEDRVRDIAARLLRGRGYEVIEARDGEEALDLARENAGRIDLMISDVSMPGMDGPALLKAARPFLAAAPVMFISGYAESEFSDLLEGETGISFLPKPLQLQSLAEQVKARLQGG
ncbi:MAG TPA: ATP-binding protein [Caulobacteraceae bacterium]|nr:ATP-binding protein [Caulobacteraceae bacterium]